MGIGRRTESVTQSYGIWLLALAVATAFSLWRLWNGGFGQIEASARNQILAVVGLGGSLTTLWFGRTSYPRVYNFKVYALGLGIGTVALVNALVFFGGPRIFATADASLYSAAVFVSYCSVLVVLLTTTASPEYLSYRITVRLTSALLSAIVLAYIVAMTVPFVRDLLAAQREQLGSYRSTVFWVFNVGAAAILVLSAILEVQSLGLGGLHAGSVLLLATGWVPEDADMLLQSSLLAVLPVLIALGTVAHWMQRLENRASYDPLLRIYNRGWCDQVLKEQSRIDTRPVLGIALIDLDHFKNVNDTHGHDAGDTVLQEIAQRIRGQLVPRGSLARYGGEELVAFIPDTDESEARALMEQVRGAVAAMPVRHKRLKINVTCSIGIALRTERSQPMEAVLKAADKAVYAAKNAGRNQVKLGRLRKKK